MGYNDDVDESGDNVEVDESGDNDDIDESDDNVDVDVFLYVISRINLFWITFLKYDSVSNMIYRVATIKSCLYKDDIWLIS